MFPPDFKDRPLLSRLWWDLMILLRRKAVKTECCQSYLTKGRACKGCALVYGPDAPNPLRRFIGSIAKQKS